MKIILTTITALISLVIIWSPGDNYSFVVNALFSAISIISCFCIFSDSRRHYTLFKTFNIFSLFFMGLAPAVQYKGAVTFWGDQLYKHDYILAGSTYLIALLIFLGVYYIEKRKHRGTRILRKLVHSRTKNQLSLTKRISLIVISSCVFLYVFYSNEFNVLEMFFRGTIDDISYGVVEVETETSNMFWLLNEYFIRPINSILAICFYIAYGKKYKISSAILFLISFATMAPTAVARFAAAAIYLPVLIILFPVLRRKHYFAITLILGLLIVWPALSIFRYFDAEADMTFSLGLKDLLESANMDTFSSLARVMKYDIVTYGKQLLGVLFFWVPRFLWSDKPVGSGAFMADTLNLNFENISCNYYAEGYLNFGFIGVILYSIVLAIIFARIDNTYWKNRPEGQECGVYFKCFYYLSLGLSFFILRGDGMSSFAYFVGYFVVLMLVKLLIHAK